MHDQIARRHFVGFSLLLAPLAGLDTTACALARLKTHESVVFDILAHAYQLTERHRPLAGQFLQRLLTPGLHTQSPATLTRWLADPRTHHQELAAYVAEEFVVATNYFAVQDRHETELQLLTLA
jgi:hypothetical protein